MESSNPSLHQQVGQDFVKILDADQNLAERIDLAKAYARDVSKPDAYIRLSGPCSVSLPSLTWSRKACTLLLWIRPIVDLETTFESESKAKSNIDRVLYRFSNSTDDTQATGVCVVHDGWKYHDDGSVRTTLTAYSMAPKVQSYANFAQTSLELKPDQWHLVGFTHYYPYLKKPNWSVVVDGSLQNVMELQYPLVDSMDHNILFSQHCLAGIELSDDQRAGSELHERPKQYSFSMDLAAVGIHQDIIPPSLQAVICQAGPQVALQSHRVVPLLPSIPNWAKGSSLEGPKVGVPLMVHASSLQMQQLVSTCIFSACAVDARILLGSTNPDQQRIVCEMALMSGQTEQTPRVGLIQPGPPQRVDPDGTPQLYATGKVSLFHSLSQTLLDRDWDVTTLGSRHWSLVWHGQDLPNVTVLPFFLALPPAGQLFSLSMEQAKFSWKQLHSLYSEEGAFAASLIHVLANTIRHGGGRLHEQILQDGTLHNLATCLRLSLIRAQRNRLFSSTPSIDEWMNRSMDDMIPSQSRAESSSPSSIPPMVVDSCLDLIDACCGPPSSRIDSLSPSMQVHRASDLSLTCTFGLALDWDLWGGDAVAAKTIFSAVSARFGPFCPTSGHILRSQVSVQYLIDYIRISYDKVSPSHELEAAAVPLCRIMHSMLLSSLTNRRSIAQGEHDISSCIRALADSLIGSLAVHVVLNGLVGLLVYCEILPLEAALEQPEVCSDEDLKMHIATRVGRNLLVSQFHDVVAPMVLSRTAFSGETLQTSGAGYNGRLSWEAHWRQTLLLFSWVASIAGAEGLTTAKISGDLLYASSLAGSLRGVFVGISGETLSCLFLPPPGMALMIGSAVRDDWSYTDFIADRFHVVMPLLPGVVVSMLGDLVSKGGSLSFGGLRTLAELLSSVEGAVHRIFGSHDRGNQENSLHLMDRGEALKNAKEFVPYFLTIAVLIERELVFCRSDSGMPIPVLLPDIASENPEGANLSSGNSLAVTLPKVDENEEMVSSLESCGGFVLGVLTDFILKAMAAGGSSASISVWQTVLDSVVKVLSSRRAGGNEVPDASISKGGQAVEVVALNVVCRLSAFVLIKCLKREYQWEPWSGEMSSSVAKLCLMIEERGLLAKPFEGFSSYSPDQIILIYSLMNVLEFGRDVTGWVQIALPTMANSKESPGGNLSETSKLVLPVLQPVFRILSGSISNINSSVKVEVGHGRQICSLLNRLLEEFDATVTAAIVGLSFSNAREMALRTLATIRNAVVCFKDSNDSVAIQLCESLFSKVIVELRERYKAEKRLRETALVDAYGRRPEDKKAAAESEAIERLILGGEIIRDDLSQSQEIDFGQQDAKKAVSDDFVIFHESSTEKSRLGFAQYHGLASSLESLAKRSEDPPTYNDALISVEHYLDAWDEMGRKESTEIELVGLFGSSLTLQNDDNVDTGNVAPLIHSSESAADAMSSFFEFSAAEKSRLKDLSVRFIPSSRYGRFSFAERFCWARFSELLSMKGLDPWERGISDGDRDIRSRIPTVPVAPQFRRYIPKYLDHGVDSGRDDEQDAMGERKIPHHTTADLDVKNLLEAANLEIVDITKKDDTVGDEEPDITLPSSQSDQVDQDEDFYLSSGTNQSDMKNEEDRNSIPESTSVSDRDVPEHEGDEGPTALVNEIVGKGGLHSVAASAFSTPPDNASSSLSLLNSAAASRIEMHVENCLHVKAEGSRQCTLLLTDTHLILEYDGDLDGFFEGELQSAKDEAERQRMAEDVGGKVGADSNTDSFLQQRIDRRYRDIAASRPKSIRWNLSEISHVYLRRYRLRDSSIEIFFIPSGGTSYGGFGMFSPSSSLFLDFGSGRQGVEKRESAAFAIMKRSPPQALKQWPDRSSQFLHEQVSRLTIGWHEGRITNFDYLLHLNMLSGRSYNDICQYPVFPWVLSDYESDDIPNLCDPKSFRDLSKPVGALNPGRLAEFLERFETFADPSIPPFMYGSHYSTSAGVVLHFLVRLHPFAGLHRQLQSGHFDVADRLFSSVPRTWAMCTGTSAAEVKELTPEWYCNPAFLRNHNQFKLGSSQDGDVIGDVALPPWAKGSPERFVEVMRAALESEICSEMLPAWIDLVFGRKQQGPEAVKANNVFFYLTYYGSVDVNSIKDDSLREAMELQIAHFGQCPMQLFRRPHVNRLPNILQRRTFFQTLSSYCQKRLDEKGEQVATHNLYGEPYVLPFSSAPLSHWIHLGAPPPGPHSPLLSVRLAGVDRCLAIDARGIFHTFRWVWRPEDSMETIEDSYFEQGCFVAQRELPRFRVVPRIPYAANEGDLPPAIAISKTLFAGRSVLLVLSSGDKHGGLAMQLVDPSKGNIRGEVLLPSIHASIITCIATEPIGTAAGHGGVGGELAIVGSADGSASLWRFMSSHYLPLRPRVRLSGHNGQPIVAVAINTPTQTVLSVSVNRCTVHSLGNGMLLRAFGPPPKLLDDVDGVQTICTTFANTSALSVSSQGFIITVCESHFRDASGSKRNVYFLTLFDMEGSLHGSLPLEPWRGPPKKMYCIPDGTAILVCCGRGITVHRVSVCHPLEIIDEWHVTEEDDVENMVAAHDLDLGPSLNRPVVAAAACSNGVLRLHALTGISSWSERHRKGGISQSVGTAFASPARRIKSAVRDGWGLGKQIAGMGLDIGREVSSDVKERGVGGFIGSFMRKKSSS